MIYTVITYVKVQCAIAVLKSKMPNIIFFRCRRYSNQRLQLFVNTRQFHTLNTNKLIFGLDDITEEQNSELFEHIQTYIKTSNIFKS